MGVKNTTFATKKNTISSHKIMVFVQIFAIKKLPTRLLLKHLRFCVCKVDGTEDVWPKVERKPHFKDLCSKITVFINSNSSKTPKT